MEGMNSPKQISKEEFYALFPERRPGQQDIAAVAGGYHKERDFNLAYAAARQRGLSHEESTWAAQDVVYGRRISTAVGAETAENSRVAKMPLSSPLPALKTVIEKAESAEPAAGLSGRQMAMRWGLPLGGGVLGLYGLTALLQPRAEQREESYAAQGME